MQDPCKTRRQKHWFIPHTHLHHIWSPPCFSHEGCEQGVGTTWYTVDGGVAGTGGTVGEQRKKLCVRRADGSKTRLSQDALELAAGLEKQTLHIPLHA